MASTRITPALTLVLFFLLVTSALAAAHGPGEESSNSAEHIEESADGSENHSFELASLLRQRALWVISGASFLVALLVILAILMRKMDHYNKWMLFLGMAVPIVFATLFSAGTTIYLNQISHTKGPVHWHADFEVWACGKELDLMDPSGLSNRIGTSTFHEHGDKRMHVEGVVINEEDASLHRFFTFVGGELHDDHLSFPTDNGFASYKNGDACPDGSLGILQVFVHKTDTVKNTFTQEKIEELEDYILSPHSLVPPGDCIIIEFAQEKESTEHLCASYKAAIARGDIKSSSMQDSSIARSDIQGGGEAHGR